MHGYYAILDATPRDLSDLGALCARAAERLAARPCCLQLRAKGSGGAAIRAAAARLLPLCRAVGVRLCVNDRLDVALAVGADVVHLGQEDLPLAAAQSLLRGRAGRIEVGVSTHSLRQAQAAEAGGADYIGFGPVFGTTSKAGPEPTVGLGALRAVCDAVRIPVVAIGGITPMSAFRVAEAGAAAAAVIGAVDAAADPTAAGRAIAESFRAH